MKKTNFGFLLALFLLLMPCLSIAQESKAEKDARMAWWRDATFGMFIHWGLYAIPAGTWGGVPLSKGRIGEWIMHDADIPVADYEKLAAEFNPIHFNAAQWVSIAKNAGMKYIVITSKHHDGFSIWDSEVATYDVMDASPFKRDILMELKEACDAAGIKLCFYHSIMDWHHPDAESPKDYTHQNNPDADWNRYRETYLIPQLTELVTKYKPAVLWFDGEWIPEWTEEQGQALYEYLMDLDPNLIINNRISKARQGMSGMNEYENAAGDFGTPEQEILESTATMDWESCMTMNDTWGYRKDDYNWKSSEQLIENLIDIAAKGGNYLLNIGPMANGKFPQASIERLYDMGAWLQTNGEAIYATDSWNCFKEGSTYFTRSADGKYVYAILSEEPQTTVQISCVNPVKDGHVEVLSTGAKIYWSAMKGGGLEFAYPKGDNFGVAQVIKIPVK
jgi:alpha-L-fucosidase